MNYYNIYKQLIQKRLKQPSTQQYTEKHHILPKSISSQSKDIVILSAREHFIAHALLVKITQKSENKQNYYKMVYAFRYMNMISPTNKHRYINSHLYHLLKQKMHNIKQRILIHNIKTNKHKWIIKNQQIPNGWIKGKSQYCVKKGQQSVTYGARWIYNQKTLEQKLLKKNQQIEQGWVYGMSPLHCQKMKEKYNAPTKGKIWISNLELEQNKMWNKDQQIPENWIPRKILNFKLYKSKLEIKKNKKIQKDKEKQQKRELAKQYLEQYKISGYKGVVQKFNYPYQYRSLLMMFKRLIPNQWKIYKSL